MKRMLSIVAGALVVGTMAFGQTNVLSQNAVGYVKVTVPASGGLSLVRMDFESIDGSPLNMQTIVGDQLGVGSVAHIWDRVSDSYISEGKTRAGWPATTEVERGGGFWLQNAAAGAESEVYLLGEVPGSNNDSDNTVIDDITGIALIGYPYPAAVAWTGTSLSVDLPVGSIIHIWDTATQSYVSTGKTRAGWGAASGTVIDPGQGFWVETSGAIDWDVAKPYAWP